MRHFAQEQTRTDESKPKHIHRSLDHVIGVQIPASQPNLQALLLQSVKFLLKGSFCVS
jgi:hypothetical protein